jgi:hypothetical protein
VLVLRAGVRPWAIRAWPDPAPHQDPPQAHSGRKPRNWPVRKQARRPPSSVELLPGLCTRHNPSRGNMGPIVLPFHVPCYNRSERAIPTRAPGLSASAQHPAASTRLLAVRCFFCAVNCGPFSSRAASPGRTHARRRGRAHGTFHGIRRGLIRRGLIPLREELDAKGTTCDAVPPVHRASCRGAGREELDAEG